MNQNSIHVAIPYAMIGFGYILITLSFFHCAFLFIIVVSLQQLHVGHQRLNYSLHSKSATGNKSRLLRLVMQQKYNTNRL